jgi:outer membrane lipoprotein-sorting protein
MREVNGEALGLKAPLDRGGEPPLVFYDKHPHGYSVAQKPVCGGLALSLFTASPRHSESEREDGTGDATPMQVPKLSRRARWAVPAAATIATGGIIAGSFITTAQAAPALPAKTPAQLLADVAAGHGVPPLTGQVVETTSLGLPQLPQEGNPTSLSSLITGSHTINVYWENAQHFRLAVPQNLSETDLIRDGGTAWLWESSRNTVTKYALPAGHGKTSKVKKAAPKVPLPLTPQQAANEALQKVGKTTAVTTQSNVMVAGEAAYQLVLAPKDTRSTIGSIRIAIDGKTGVPLQLQVFARGAASPAFQIGYTQISYVAPDPSNLTFTPPPGAKMTTANTGSPQGKHQPGALPAGTWASQYGSGWLSVAELPAATLSIPATSKAGSQAKTAPASGGGALGSGTAQEAVNALFGSAKQVHGAWGTGRLLHTSLVNVLFVGNEAYVGAVSPSVLEAAAQAHANTKTAG